MTRVIFLIRSLDSGGAERQLVALARNLDPREFQVTVITYYRGGRLGAELLEIPNVKVVSANKRGRWDTVGFIWRLWRLVRQERPDIVHGYMYGANELAWLLGRAARARVIWGIRASGLELQHYDWATHVLWKTGAWLSSRPDAIIANSDAGRDDHIQYGYRARKFLVIPNGIDTRLFGRDERGRERIRAEWQVSDDEVLIGIVARIDPMKDHETFLRAAGELGADRAVRFVIVGAGSERQLSKLRAVAAQLGIVSRVSWVGPRSDMAAVYSAIDIMTSASAFGEGFSNCLAEAMACQTICVATDVGDARLLVDDTGEIVPPRQPHELANAWRAVLAESREQRAERGRRARARIVDCFSVAALADRTGDAFRSVLGRDRPADSLI